MASVEKIVTKMQNQPNGITFDEASKVLQANGYKLDRQKGSHCHFINDKGNIITIPFKNPIKKIYVTAILKLISQKE